MNFFFDKINNKKIFNIKLNNLIEISNIINNYMKTN